MHKHTVFKTSFVKSLLNVRVGAV